MALAVVFSVLGALIPGSPIGGTDPVSAEAVPAGSPGVARYFGKGAYQGIRAAVAATPRSCALSDDELTALVMAPIFKEVSMAETPQTAPSPMTLSRWDEWTGRVSGSNNLNANYGLYAFRDPNTRYTRAYWTPGIGIFQYDVAGVGAPFTAAQLMNVQYISGHVAAGMAGRYCGAGGDAFTRRTAAWQPWQALGGIAKSEALFQEMIGAGHPPFSTIGLVDGIDNAGGMELRTCMLSGKPRPCYFVDPGRAQGANWWATTNPTGGAVASGEAPLTAPFYIVERGGFEERHWLSYDTGYPVHVSAARKLGYNARPVDAQAGSGLRWSDTSDLCDTTRRGMGCPLPAEPAPAPAPEEPAAVKADAPEADAAADADAEATSALWDALARLQAESDAAPEPEAEPEPPATSTFSFAKGLALVPPASQ